MSGKRFKHVTLSDSEIEELRSAIRKKSTPAHVREAIAIVLFSTETPIVDHSAVLLDVPHGEIRRVRNHLSRHGIRSLLSIRPPYREDMHQKRLDLRDRILAALKSKLPGSQNWTMKLLAKRLGISSHERIALICKVFDIRIPVRYPKTQGTPELAAKIRAMVLKRPLDRAYWTIAELQRRLGHSNYKWVRNCCLSYGIVIKRSLWEDRANLIRAILKEKPTGPRPWSQLSVAKLSLIHI